MITFYPQQFWIEETDCLIVHAFTGGAKIRCIMPMEYLTAPFAEVPTEARAREIFRERQVEFESKLREKIEDEDFNEQGEIVLNS